MLVRELNMLDRVSTNLINIMTTAQDVESIERSMSLYENIRSRMDEIEMEISKDEEEMPSHGQRKENNKSSEAYFRDIYGLHVSIPVQKDMWLLRKIDDSSAVAATEIKEWNSTGAVIATSTIEETASILERLGLEFKVKKDVWTDENNKQVIMIFV